MSASNPDSPSSAPASTLPRSALLRRRAKRWLLYALIALVPTVPAFVFALPIWHLLVPLGSTAFLIASLTWGLLMAAGPVAVLLLCLMALFARIEACFAAPETPRGGADWLFIGLGLLVSLLPALAALYVPVKALLTGYIAFRGPGQRYTLAGDPYGFWQAVAFWLMGVATLAFLASLYWRSRFCRSARPSA